MAGLELLEQTGALRALLLLDERQRYITELRRTSLNPKGIVSQDALMKIRHNLKNLGLAEEVTESGPRPKTFLVITEKGKKVAEKIREIQGILEE